MHYVYLMESTAAAPKRYVGYTDNLRQQALVVTIATLSTPPLNHEPAISGGLVRLMAN